jgi:hypothetical protein
MSLTSFAATAAVSAALSALTVGICIAGADLAAPASPPVGTHPGGGSRVEGSCIAVADWHLVVMGLGRRR